MNEKQRLAFEQYAAMGSGRSLTKLAEHLGLAPNTLKNWSCKFQWQEKLEDRDRSVAEVVAEKAIKSDIDFRVRNKQIVQLALVRLAQQLADGTVKCSLSDLDRLVRLEAFLEGEADSRPEIIARDLRGKSIAELREILRAEIEDLTRLENSVEKTSPTRTAETLGSDLPSER